MRRLVYAVAAVLALAPLAAIAPASAAVQHPAAAQTTCTGGWNAGVIYNENYQTYKLVGSWYVQLGQVLDSSSSSTVFCDVILSARDSAFREKGTSSCVAYVPSSGLTEMRGCDYSSLNQQWRSGYGSGFLTTESSLSKCLDSRSGTLFMNGCATAPDNQYWFWP